MDLQDIKNFAEYQRDHWLESTGRITKYDVYNNTLTFNGEEFSLNEHARGQLFTRLHINGAYSDFVDSMAEKDQDRHFFQQAINRKIELGQKTDSLIVYDEANNNIKSVKSDRYKRIYNIDVLEKVKEQHEGNFNKRDSYINDNRMHVSFGNVRNKTTQDNRGDVMGFGFRVWNSETGASSVGVGRYIVRLACTNGMVTRENYDFSKYKHLHENLLFYLENDITKMLDEQSMEKIVGVFNRAMRRPAVIEGVEQMPKILSMNGIQAYHHEGIVTSYQTEPLGKSNDGINGWGIYNAVTRYNTHLFPNYPNYSHSNSEELMSAAYPLLQL